jgi:hypothetical protein
MGNSQIVSIAEQPSLGDEQTMETPCSKGFKQGWHLNSCNRTP